MSLNLEENLVQQRYVEDQHFLLDLSTQENTCNREPQEKRSSRPLTMCTMFQCRGNNHTFICSSSAFILNRHGHTCCMVSTIEPNGHNLVNITYVGGTTCTEGNLRIRKIF
jgi:hypothetical protein